MAGGCAPRPPHLGLPTRSNYNPLLLKSLRTGLQKRDHDNHSDIHTFRIGDPVFVIILMALTNDPIWLSDEIKEVQVHQGDTSSPRRFKYH